MEKIVAQNIGKDKINSEYNPIEIKEGYSDYYKDYQYGQTIEKLKIGREVKDDYSSLYASILATGLQSIPNNTVTVVTGLSTKVGDTTMTATTDQITITKNGNYSLSAFAFCGWSSNIIFRILKNGTSIVPQFQSGTSSASITATINTMQTLVSGDVLTLIIYQDSGINQTLQNGYLAVSKL